MSKLLEAATADKDALQAKLRDKEHKHTEVRIQNNRIFRAV